MTSGSAQPRFLFLLVLLLRSAAQVCEPAFGLRRVGRCFLSTGAPIFIGSPVGVGPSISPAGSYPAPCCCLGLSWGQNGSRVTAAGAIALARYRLSSAPLTSSEKLFVLFSTREEWKLLLFFFPSIYFPSFFHKEWGALKGDVRNNLSTLLIS